MRTEHLSGHELDLFVSGETVGGDAAEHVATCVYCRRRLEAVTSVIHASRLADPDRSARERVRGAALATMGSERASHRRWLWAAAAALAVAALSPVVLRTSRQPAPVDATKVLAQVDTVLDEDPVTAVFSADVVSVVAPSADANEEGSAS